MKLYLAIMALALSVLAPSVSSSKDALADCTFPAPVDGSILVWNSATTLQDGETFSCTGTIGADHTNYVLNQAGVMVTIADSSPPVGPSSFTLALGQQDGDVWDNLTKEGDDGQLVIENGTMMVGPGITLRVPGGIWVKGPNGKLKAQGAKLGEASIASIDWTDDAGDPNDIKITFDRNVQDMGLVQGMYIVMMDEDPGGVHEKLTGSKVQSGSGTTTTGAHRPSYSKWKWLYVLTVSGAVVNVELDPWEGHANEGGDLVYDGIFRNTMDTAGGGPYMGKRGVALKAATALTQNTSQSFNLTSALKVNGLKDLIDSDLGSQYVEFTSGVCNGKLTKVINVEAMGTTHEITAITSGVNSQITTATSHGMQNGDTVYLFNTTVSGGSDILNEHTFKVSQVAATTFHPTYYDQTEIPIKSIGQIIGAGLQGIQVTTYGNHNLVNGQSVVFSGLTGTLAVPGDLNGNVFQVANATSCSRSAGTACTYTLESGGTRFVSTGSITPGVGQHDRVVDTTGNTFNGEGWSYSENSSGDDIIYVAGDTSECGLANVIIHPGLRSGDKVALVNPATIDFSRVASPRSFQDLHGYLAWMGGTVEMEWTRLIRFGALGRDTGGGMGGNGLAVKLERACSLCIFQQSATISPESGYIKNVDLGTQRHFFNGTSVDTESGLDTGFLYPVSSQYGALPSCSRFVGTTLDLAGLGFDRLFVHDSVISDTNINLNGSGAGMHGIWADRVNNFNVSRARVERISDDGVGWIASSCGDEVDQRISWNQFLVYEMIASENNSQESMSLNKSGYGVGGKSDVARYFNQTNFSNALVFGAAGPNLQAGGGVPNMNAIIAGQPTTIHGATSAGTMQAPQVNYACTGNQQPVDCCTGINDGTCHTVYPQSDTEVYSGYLKNSLISVNYSNNKRGQDTATENGCWGCGNAKANMIKSRASVINSLLLMPFRDNSSNETAASSIAFQIPDTDGSLIVSGNARRLITGSSTVSPQTCTNKSSGVPWSAALGSPFVNWYGRQTKVSYKDTLFFVPPAGTFGNNVEEVDSCVGLEDLSMDRVYMAIGGDGTEWSMGAGGNSTNSQYFKDSLTQSSTDPKPSARVVNSTLSYSNESRFLAEGQGTADLGLQTSWGCDAGGSSEMKCNLSDRPDGNASEYSGLCASARRRSTLADSFTKVGNYGSTTAGFSDPLYNNTITEYVGPSPVMEWADYHLDSNSMQKVIGSVSIAAAAVVSSVAHGYIVDDKVHLSHIEGTVGDLLNGNVYKVMSKTDNTFNIGTNIASPVAISTSGLVYGFGGYANLAGFSATIAKNNFYLSDFIQPDSSGGCGASRPKRLGFSDWEVSHSMMGDIMLEQWRSYSTDELDIEVVPGS